MEERYQYKMLEPIQPPANTCVAPDPLDVQVFVQCFLAHYSEGAKVDWSVLMSTLQWEWNTYLMLKMDKHLITYNISFQFVNIQHCYYDHYYTQYLYVFTY